MRSELGAAGAAALELEPLGFGEAGSRAVAVGRIRHGIPPLLRCSTLRGSPLLGGALLGGDVDGPVVRALGALGRVGGRHGRVLVDAVATSPFVVLEPIATGLLLVLEPAALLGGRPDLGVIDAAGELGVPALAEDAPGDAAQQDRERGRR